jgi:hypothetical protein
MRPHKLAVQLSLVLFLLGFCLDAFAQQRKPPTGGRLAVVIDERLAALRSTPNLGGKLVRRLGRGRLVAITGAKTSRDGIVFYRVNVTSRTRGWIQSESVVSPFRSGDDHRLFNLIEHSQGFDRIVRARIFLDHFHRSPLRPAVLLLIGDTAESLATQLTQSISRKRNNSPFYAPEHTYYLNHPSLDRYNRQNIRFVFDGGTKRLHYDGLAWRLLLRHHPKTPEAAAARQRLVELNHRSKGEKPD